MMSYGTRIKTAREAARLTQEDLAEQLDVSRQAVSKWEADKSRPAAGKLELLSQVLDIPIEDWAAIDEQEAEAARRANPLEQKLCFWRSCSAVLALGLCLSLGISAALLTRTAPAENAPSSEVSNSLDPSVAFPMTIPLHEEEIFSLESLSIADPGDPTDLPFLHNQAELERHTIWYDFFGKQIESHTVFLRAVRANPIQENGTTFYDVYLLYEKGGEIGILCRLAQNNHYINNPDSSWHVEPFSHVLGESGFKLSLSFGLNAVVNCYVALGEDGLPHIIACLDSGGLQTMDVDLNEDGEKEIVSQWGTVPTWTIWAQTDDIVKQYDLSLTLCGVPYLCFQPDKGGFVVTDQKDHVLVRYLLGDGQLIRQPQTTYTSLDYPDAVVTALHFPEGHPDPDEVLLRENGIRITRRQQVYLALQELFHLTGQLPEECFCTVDEGGLVQLSTQSDFSDYFCQMQLGANCGGSVERIPGVDLTWQEQGFAHSPLHAGSYGLPYSSNVAPLSYYFDQLHFLADGEVAQATEEELFLTDGSHFIGELMDSGEDHQILLLSLHGPMKDPLL